MYWQPCKYFGVEHHGGFGTVPQTVEAGVL